LSRYGYTRFRLGRREFLWREPANQNQRQGKTKSEAATLKGGATKSTTKPTAQIYGEKFAPQWRRR
jgi:hypothetical protein